MPRGRKRDKLKQWLAGFSASKSEVYPIPDGPQQPAGSSHSVLIDNTIHVSGTGHVVTRQDGQGDRHLVSQMMSLLSQHIIRGAGHDDSARDPPPRCHPGTRIKLVARITAWFNGEAQDELLLWITGPAGVGKSAIVQTFAEYLAKNYLLGASIFISRPNRRNNPRLFFSTIAYQLATRFEAYRTFITERLSINPELPNTGLAAQFQAFIIEPFVERKIGAGEKRWGILLDGLDELDGQDAQCEIIQLITAFVHEHRDTPLVWVIASRPEPHISNTFDDDVNRCFWSEYIPIDSTEACEDVERFLRSSFEETRRKFRQGVPVDWPSGTEFLKITAAASGLFVYAEVVKRFIIDPTAGDPLARLQVLSSVIDRSNNVSTSDNPFLQLDALYKEILSLVPSRLWSSTKRLLGYIVHAEHINGPPYDLYVLRPSLQTLRGLALLFGLSPYTVSACLLKCHSTVRVPDWKDAHKETITVLHASFADFLKDPDRSGDYYVGSASDAKDEIASFVFKIWNECSRGTDSVRSKWQQYCSLCDDRTTSNAITKFDAEFYRNIVAYVRGLVYQYNQRGEPVLYKRLCEINMIKLCHTFDTHDLQDLVENLVKPSTHISNTPIVQRVPLKRLGFGHLNWEDLSPAYTHQKAEPDVFLRSGTLSRPCSRAELDTFVSELQSLKEHSPELEVTVFGGVSKGRVAAFRDDEKSRFYTIPYSE